MKGKGSSMVGRVISLLLVEIAGNVGEEGVLFCYVGRCGIVIGTRLEGGPLWRAGGRRLRFNDGTKIDGWSSGVHGIHCMRPPRRRDGVESDGPSMRLHLPDNFLFAFCFLPALTITIWANSMPPLHPQLKE